MNPKGKPARRPARAPSVRARRTSPCGSRSAVFNLADALGEVLGFERPADVAMSAFFRARPKMGRRDRSEVAEALFFAMRHFEELSFRMRPARPAKDTLAAARLVTAMIEGSLPEDLRPREGDFLKEALARDFTRAAPHAQAEMPEWLYEKIVAQNPDSQAYFEANKRGAPLDVRVNALKTSRSEVLEQMARLGWEAFPTPFSALGVRLFEKPSLTSTELFARGLVDVQDEGSQLVAQLVQARPGEMVCDFCAGAGGKTLAIGAQMRGKGRLYAFDVNVRRLEALAPRARRAGLSNVYAAPIRNERDLRVKRLKGKFDRVLVDAPCSGTGTFRRNPDLKFRLSPEEFDRLAALQADILESASTLVKPGGRLVYATCSVMREEDESQVSSFLERHPEFELADAVDILARQKVRLDEASASHAPFLRLSPETSATDGFFAAVLLRKAA